MPAPAHPPRVVFLTADGFDDMELFYPMFRLLETGTTVDVAAPTMDPIHGEHGDGFKPAKPFDEIDPEAYDLLIIPGGFPDGAGHRAETPEGDRDYPGVLREGEGGGFHLPRALDAHRRP